MKNYKSNSGFWRTVLIIVAAVLVINAVSSSGIFHQILSVFSQKADTSFYVHDNAGVLSKDATTYITNKNASLKAQTGAEITVVTLSALNGEDIADKAYSLFSEYKPGDTDKQNGVLLLFAINDGKYYAIQGRGIEDSLSAGTLQLLLNSNAGSYFASADYETGIKLSFDAVADHFEKMYSVSVSGNYSPSHYSDGESLFDHLGTLLAGVTGIAKKLIKTAIILVFALFGIISATVLIALSAKDKKNGNGPEKQNSKQKENKNPYSKK